MLILACSAQKTNECSSAICLRIANESSGVHVSIGYTDYKILKLFCHVDTSQPVDEYNACCDESW